MKIAIGCDHGGWELKAYLQDVLKEWGHEIWDAGTNSANRVDYPEFAARVCRWITSGMCERGVLVCGTGIGMSLAANRLHGIRAALCHGIYPAEMTRRHNDANVIVFGGRTIGPEIARAGLLAFLQTDFEGGRHARRLELIDRFATMAADRTAPSIPEDVELNSLIVEEVSRQHLQLTLIASENYASGPIRRVMGTVLTNKYAEGYPGQRHYPGCAVVDRIEELARHRACELFRAPHANVQAYSGTVANNAVLAALLKPGDTILAMSEQAGGHTSHGNQLSLAAGLYHTVLYGLDNQTERIDLDQVRSLALRHSPRLIIVGTSVYSRQIDFSEFRAIADETGAFLLADMAHIAGLVAAGLHDNPVPYADMVTSTTHKTLRGPRGGLVLSQTALAEKLDAAVFPMLQGGPLVPVMAAKALAFREAATPEFHSYMTQVLINAKILAETLQERGYRLLSGGTDTHMLMIDTSPLPEDALKLEAALERAGILVNGLPLPFAAIPGSFHALRLGTPAITTLGMKEDECRRIAVWIDLVCRNPQDEKIVSGIRNEVAELMRDARETVKM